MATRGHTGGIAANTKNFIHIMEAMGKEIVILETVGVGQDQVAIIFCHLSLGKNQKITKAK